MEENFVKTSILGASEKADTDYSPAMSGLKDVTNAPEFHSFFNDDDFGFPRHSTMTRWRSQMENLSFENNLAHRAVSSTKRNPANDFSSFAGRLAAPMSRLSTSSSFMSFNSVGSYTTSEPLSSQSTLAKSTDQLFVSNENINLFSSPPSSVMENDLQQVPPSFIIVQPTNTPGRSNSMPTWRGHLPLKPHTIPFDPHQISAHFSQKIFLGGIPPELTEAELLLVLRKFGKCNIKWPKHDGINHNMPGFCHVVFRESRSVSELLSHCTQQQQRSTIDYFLHIQITPTINTGLSMRINRIKPVQVVPWNVRDNVFVIHHQTTGNDDISAKDWSRTIFVSPLHGKMTAFSLATIMSNVFGPVSVAQINTDKYGYPTGTGTVMFCDSHSYMRGVAAGAIDIKCDCFHKLIDIDPFLRENETCAHCGQAGDLFCRNFHCLRSYCKQCWVNRHGAKPLADHQPATRRQHAF